jgi:hypothetical protein
MSETSHKLTRTERVVWCLLLPVIHIYFRLCINAFNSVEWFFQLVYSRRQEEDRRSIKLTAHLSEEPSHLNRVSLGVKSIMSSWMVVHVLTIEYIFVYFTNHIPVSCLVFYSKGIACSTFTYRFGTNLYLSDSFFISKFQILPIFFACFLR